MTATLRYRRAFSKKISPRRPSRAAKSTAGGEGSAWYGLTWSWRSRHRRGLVPRRSMGFALSAPTTEPTPLLGGHGISRVASRLRPSAGRQGPSWCLPSSVPTGRMLNAFIFPVTGCRSRGMATGRLNIRTAFGSRIAALFVSWSRSMNFSIKATIRACVAPRHRLSCAERLWNEVLAELERRGGRRHEAGVFLLGNVRGAHREVQAAIFYDDLILMRTGPASACCMVTPSRSCGRPAVRKN